LQSIQSIAYYLEDFQASIGGFMTDKIRIVIQALEDSIYTFDTFKSKKKVSSRLQTVYFCFHEHTEAMNQSFESAIQIGCAIAAGIKLTKDLVNSPANVCTPSYMAEIIKNLACKTNNLR